MRRIFWGTCCIAVASLAGGCASITGSEMQSVLVSSKEKSGAIVEKAECVLESPRGIWKVVTPGSVMIMRSAEDIQVQCSKDGHVPGLAKLISRAHGGMFGNIILGGGIGALIDHSKGTGYEYPNVVVVVMGETTMIDRRHEIEQEQQGAQSPSGTAAPSDQGTPACKGVTPPGGFGGAGRC